MKKNQKTIMYAVLGVGALVGGYFLYKKFTKPAELGEGARGGEETEVEEEAVVAPTKSKFPLRKGSRGSEVKELQQYLNRSPMCKRKMPKSTPNSRVAKILPLDEDGIFGNLTETALEICYGTKTLDEALWKRISGALPTLSVD